MRPLCGWARRVTCPHDPGARTSRAVSLPQAPPTTPNEGQQRLHREPSKQVDGRGIHGLAGRSLPDLTAARGHLGKPHSSLVEEENPTGQKGAEREGEGEKKRHSKSRRGVVGDGGRFAITHHPSPIITHAIPACPWDSHAACQGGMMGIRAGLVI